MSTTRAYSYQSVVPHGIKYETDKLSAILILAARDVPQAAEPVAGRPKEALAEVKVALTGPFCRPAPQARQPVVRKMRIADKL
jgi:hypothetical protein